MSESKYVESSVLRELSMRLLIKGTTVEQAMEEALAFSRRMQADPGSTDPNWWAKRIEIIERKRQELVELEAQEGRQ